MKKVIFLVLALLFIGGGIYLIFFRKMPGEKLIVPTGIDAKYEHYVDWQKDGKVTRKVYGSVEFKPDRWTYRGYDLSDETNVDTISGSYDFDKEDKNKIYAYFEDEEGSYSINFYIDGDKLCQTNKGCNNYYVKTTSNLSNHLTLEEYDD